MSRALPSEEAAVVGRVDPKTVANTEQQTDVVDMSRFGMAMFIALLGDMANETIDFRVLSSVASGGPFTPISGRAVTQLAASATANDNRQLIINLTADQMPTGHRFVRAGLVTGGVTGGAACVVALGFRPKYGPASDDDLATVAQIIV